MTPDERQLITGLFDRLRQTGLPEKDRDAEQLINVQLRQTPDSGYMLVQSVIVQEMTLEQLQARVEELEDQVRQLERARPQQSSGSFLGGLFGGGSSAQRSATGSVPATSRQSSGFGQGPVRAPGQPASPWGNQGQAAPAQQPAGGGFMRSAMATAAGVAGGMLAANAISNMLGGGGSAHASPLPSGGGSSGSNADAGYGSQSEDMADENNDPGSFSSFGGGDDGGGGWGDGGGDE